MKKTVLLILLFFGSVSAGLAQRVALKNNLAYDATLTPNLSLEVAMGQKWTFDLTGAWNPFQVLKDNKKWKHWLVQPEFRYWFCERFNGWFMGAHALGGQFNFGGIKWPNIAYTSTNFILNRNPQIYDLKTGQPVAGRETKPFENVGNYRYQGWYGGAGLSVGYQWILNNHWNFEASIGGGWVHLYYDKFNCETCGKKISERQEADYFGITRATLSLVYLFR